MRRICSMIPKSLISKIKNYSLTSDLKGCCVNLLFSPSHIFFPSHCFQLLFTVRRKLLPPMTLVGICICGMWPKKLKVDSPGILQYPEGGRKVEGSQDSTHLSYQPQSKTKYHGDGHDIKSWLENSKIDLSWVCVCARVRVWCTP